MHEAGVTYNDQDMDEDEFAQDRSPQTGVPRFTQVADSKKRSQKVAPRGPESTTDEKGVSRKDAPSRSTRLKSTTDEKGASKTAGATKLKKLKSKRNKVRCNAYAIRMLITSSQ